MGGICLALVLMVDRISIFLIVPILVALFLVLCHVTLMLFNLIPEKAYMQDTNPPIDFAQRMLEWEAQGMLITEEFQAKRAFQVEESDEGPHFFLELQDGYVLYLNGQYLDPYVYPGDGDDDSTEGIPLFPCTEFTIKRHHQEGWVVELICHGQLLEAEMLDFSFWESDYWSSWNDFPFQDGKRIINRTYDQLKLVN